MNYEYIEYFIIGVIIIIQAIVFYKGFKRISTFKKIIPPKTDLSLEENQIILNSKTSSESSSLFKSINIYLSKSKPRVPNFNVIKDIVERKVSGRESNIRFRIPIPLYLGLVGTILGIIIGLFTIPDITSVEQDASISQLEEYTNLSTQSVNNLLQAVKIAMFASLIGLSLTVINGNYVLRKAKERVDKLKNDLYDFIQTEVLTSSSQDISGTLHALERSLLVFNQDFTKNIAAFNEVAAKNYTSVKKQSELFDILRSSDFSELVRLNIQSSEQIQETIRSFVKFREDLGDIHKFSASTHNLFKQIETLFNTYLSDSKTREESLKEINSMVTESLSKLHSSSHDSIKKITETLQQSIQQSLQDITKSVLSNTREKSSDVSATVEEFNQATKETLKSFSENVQTSISDSLIALQEHTVAALDQRNEKFSATMIKVDDTVQQSLQALRKHTEDQIKAIGEIGIKGDLSVQAFDNKVKETFSKMEHDMQKIITSIQDNLGNMVNQIQKEFINEESLKNVKKSLKTLDKLTLLEDINKQTSRYQYHIINLTNQQQETNSVLQDIKKELANRSVINRLSKLGSKITKFFSRKKHG